MANYLRTLYFLTSMMGHCYWKSDKLERFRIRELKRVLKYAYGNVPFWHEKFREIGLKPSDVKSLSDLDRLPIVRKADVRSNLDRMVSDQYDPRRLRMLSTSGSTGQPLCFYINGREDELRKVRHLRANINCGQKVRDRWVTISSPRLSEKTGKLQEMLRFYSLNRVSVFMDVSEQISLIERLRPDVLEGYSSSLFLLAKELDRRGLKTIRPRLMFGGAELIDDYSRSFVERAFGAPFYDHYASIEFERMAWQCPKKTGYHIDADALVMQFVDDHGEEVAAGESGEIVCTSLFNYAFPFIRYAIGDVGVPSDEECACGRSFPLMKMLEGRRDSVLRFPDGRVVSPRSFTVAVRLFDGYGDIDQFRVIQRRKNRVEVLVKLKLGVAEPQVLAEKLLRHLQNVLHLSESGVDASVSFTDEISLDKSGKLMAVVSEVGET